ncbi:glycosyltransferase family protein [Methylobacterium oxalidis]|uniref:glycosyltransferase family protein n=1 Tax=Methylobacterium oxalidis TaxID=944322 RepID=UPI003314FF83
MAKTRVAVVGHRPYFGLHMPISDEMMSVEQFEFYHKSENTVFNSFEIFKPDILFAFRPELVPLSILLSFSGVKIGFSSEIFPKRVGNKIHADMSHIAKFDFFDNNVIRKYDFMFHYDVASREFLEERRIYMSDFPPYPLSTSLFFEERVERDIDVLFIGRVSPRRYSLLEPLKRKNIRLVSIDHGFYGDELITLLRRSKIVLNIHAENHISFEPRSLIGAAAGSVVVTEAIHVPHWLKENPFVYTNEICSNLEEKIDEVLCHYREYAEKAEEYRKVLKSKCSANTLLIEWLNNIRSGQMRHFRAY